MSEPAFGLVIFVVGLLTGLGLGLSGNDRAVERLVADLEACGCVYVPEQPAHWRAP